MNPKVKSPYFIFLLTLVIIIIVLSILLYSQSNPKGNDLNNNLLWGIVGGLATYIITFSMAQKFLYTPNDQILEKIENIQNKFPSHETTTQTILDVVQCKFMTLISYNRNTLLGKEFYDNVYKESTEIKVLGITLEKFLEALISEKPKHVIIDQLFNNDNIVVKILLLNPTGSFVKFLDKQEGTVLNPYPATKKIKDVLLKLERFSKLDPMKGTNNDNKLDIRLTDENITLTFSYVQKKSESDDENIFLLGLMYGHKEGGPLYKLPYNMSDELFIESMNYFDKLFNGACSQQIFSWDETGKHFAKNLLK
ncbi:MAG: hypothetical protein ACQERU_08910 [Bacteroidota bacterium]